MTRLSQFVKDFFGRLEVDRKLAAGMRLGLEEAVVNVINYAYPPDEEGEVHISVDSDGKEVRFTIVDSGFPFDPTSWSPIPRWMPRTGPSAVWESCFPVS